MTGHTAWKQIPSTLPASLHLSPLPSRSDAKRYSYIRPREIIQCVNGWIILETASVRLLAVFSVSVPALTPGSPGDPSNGGL